MKRRKILKRKVRAFVVLILAAGIVGSFGILTYQIIKNGENNQLPFNTSKQISRGFTEEELSAGMPLLLQWDERWGSIKYGEQPIAYSGCGPTALSMVMIALKKDKALTPYEIARFSEKNGYLVEGHGTAWSLMTDGAGELGLQARELPLSESKMKAELDAGHPIICIVGPGDFTTEGHFIVLYDYSESGFCIKDPNSIEKSRERWDFERLEPQIRNLWAYSIK